MGVRRAMSSRWRWRRAWKKGVGHEGDDEDEEEAGEEGIRRVNVG